MTTALIRPNCEKGYSQSISFLRACEPPLWLVLMSNLYIKSMIIDAEAKNLSIQDTYTKLKEYTHWTNNEIDKIVILITGSHPSAYVQQKDIGEEWKRFFLDANYNVELYYSLLFDPTEMKVPPPWDLLEMNKYRAHNWHCFGGWPRNNYGTIFTSVSCPFQCKFCTIKSFYSTGYSRRDLEITLKDLYLQFEKYGIVNYKMMDELFVINNKHTIEFCEEVAKTIGDKINIWAYARIDTVNERLLKLLKSAGVRWLAFGIESGNYDIRREVNKGTFTNQKIIDIIKMTKNCGINIIGNFMFGFWDDNFETMNETFDLAVKLNCEFANFYCTVAYPGSPLYKKMKDLEVDLPQNSIEYSQMNYEFKPLSTKYLTNKEVLKFRDDAFLLYFNNVGYLSMMEQKFGDSTIEEIQKMLSVKIERKILKDVF